MAISMRLSKTTWAIIIINSLTAMMLIATGLFWFSHPSRLKPMPRLLRTIGNKRVTEGRLVGFPYATYLEPIASAEKKKQLEQSELQKALLTQDNDLSKTESQSDKATKSKKSKASITRGVTSLTNSANYQEFFFDDFLDNSYFPDLTDVVFAKTKFTRSKIESDKTDDYNPILEENPNFKLAISDILYEGYFNPSLEITEAVAVAHIFSSEFNSAIECLENGIKESPKNANFFNDLAVAYLARAKDEDNPADIFDALSAIDSALEINPNLIEAQYNRALILQKLYLYPSAKKYWAEYLQKETSSQWKAEVAKYIAKLDEPTLTELWEKEKNNVVVAASKNDYETVKALVTKFPHFARLAALDEMLPAWATSYLKGDFDQAKQPLQTAQLIGRVLIEIQDDHLVADAVATLTKISEQPTASKDLTALAQAHLSYQEGRKLGEMDDADKSIKPLAEALATFSQYNDNALTALIYINQARSYIPKLDHKNTFAKLEQAQLLSERYYYPYLLGRIWALKGQEQAKIFQINKALESYSLATKYLKQTVALNSLAATLIRYSQVLSELTEPKQTLNQYYETLQSFSKMNMSLQKTVSALSIATYLIQVNKIKPVFYFCDDIFDTASKNKLDKVLFTMLRWRSLAYHKIDKEKLALQDVKQAKTYTSQFEDQVFRSRAEDELAIAEGEYLLKTNPEQAIKLFTQAITTYLQAKAEQEQIAHLYLLRARAYLNLNDYQNSENDLKASIREFEIARSNIKYESFRTNFFEKPQEVYDEMIELQIKLNHPDIAFDYAEVRQARALLDLISAKTREVELLNDPQFILDNTVEPLKLSAIQEKLPAKYTLVSYTFLSEKLYVWCITKDKLHSLELPIKEEEIKKLINQFYGSIGSYTKRETIKPQLATVYQAIFQPILPFISQEQTLVFIPSKSLYQIPFSALFDVKTNQYLIEKQKVVVSPSATIFIKCLERSQQLAKQNSFRNILAVGNPIFNKKYFVGLSDLPGAEEEAKGVIKFYPSSKLLLNKEATKAQFLSLLNGYDVIHFAGHSVMDAQAPLYSQLVFAEDITKGRSSSLYAYEIYKQRFNHTKLVVLAACKTANGRNLSNEGIASIARPFLAAGVPTVVASLWNASDDASKELFTVFHERLVATNDPIEALQSAQLHLIKNSLPSLQAPQMWAPFVLLGMSSNQSK